jgi:predicted metalloprotease with PDZ domain
LEDLDREIREMTKERRSLDDVTRRLMQVRKVSTQRFIETAEQVAGGRLRTLASPLLR